MALFSKCDLLIEQTKSFINKKSIQLRHANTNKYGTGIVYRTIMKCMYQARSQPDSFGGPNANRWGQIWHSFKIWNRGVQSAAQGPNGASDVKFCNPRQWFHMLSTTWKFFVLDGTLIWYMLEKLIWNKRKVLKSKILRKSCHKNLNL